MMFDFSQFMPHGHCYLWRPEILWLHTISDGLIALSYFSIPVALVYFIYKRKEITFRWMVGLFVLFIFFCGLTHAMNIYTTWVPNYAVEGLVKAATASISVVTAILLWPLIPQALQLPSPKIYTEKVRELEELNRNLEERVIERTKDARQLAAIVSNSHDAILSKDLNGTVLSWNQAAERIFGYTAEEMIGQSVYKIIPQRLRQDEESMLNHLRSSGLVAPFESVRVRQDGSEFPVLVSISVMRDANGGIYAFSSLIQDIAQKAQMVKQLEETSKVLKERNKQLVELNKAKDEFIANLSHELRSPLNVIVGYADLLGGYQAGSQEQLRAVEVIKRNAETQLHLVEDLLDMSRIISGKLSMNPVSCDISEIIDNAIKAVQFAGRTKNIKITKTIKTDEAKIVCDPDRIHQVLWNLLSNAVKFTGDGGEITVKGRRDNGNFVLEVEDNGIGIAAHELPHIFDRLWQSEQGQGGLGLGLRITKDLVEAHGGVITAFSAGLGLGARMRITLPIPAVVENDGQNTNAAGRTLSGMRVLVVDDTVDAVELVRLVLERAGATVITAHNGAQALEIIRANDIQLIISDINMPVMDGYVFMQQTREIERQRGHASGRPAIALTARVGRGEQERAYEAGYQLHLVKPVNPSVLVNKVLSVMGKHNA